MSNENDMLTEIAIALFLSVTCLVAGEPISGEPATTHDSPEDKLRPCLHERCTRRRPSGQNRRVGRDAQRRRVASGLVLSRLDIGENMVDRKIMVLR